MRKILDCPVAVVGGAGFLGSHLVDHLIDDRGCQVWVIDNLVAGRREFVNTRAEFVHHDITRSEERLKNLFTSRKVKFVFNYAAEPYIPVSFQRPLHVFDVNALGALKVINAAQESGCEGILQVSSAEIYGSGWTGGDVSVTTNTNKLNESAPVCPHSSYGAAKAAIDAMVQVRWKEAQTPVIALRQFNCVGERETHPYVIPEIIRQLDTYWGSKGLTPFVKLGNNSFRDFQYAGDAVRMATELLEKGKFGEVYNMGSEEGVTIFELAKLIACAMDLPEPRIQVELSRVRPWEIWHLQSENAKLYSVIDGRPQVSFTEALKRTIAYFKENGSKWCWEK